jgi:hypothetical protein
MGYISHEIHQSSAFFRPGVPRKSAQPGKRKSGIPDSTEMPAPVKAVMEPPVNPWSFLDKSSIWVNYNISRNWIKAIGGWFPLLNMIPVRSQWGRYNLPRIIDCLWPPPSASHGSASCASGLRTTVATASPSCAAPPKRPPRLSWEIHVADHEDADGYPLVI